MRDWFSRSACLKRKYADLILVCLCLLRMKMSPDSRKGDFSYD